MTKKAFTFIETLLVIGIIAILAGIVFIAIGPNPKAEYIQNCIRHGNFENTCRRLSNTELEQFKNAVPMEYKLNGQKKFSEPLI